MEGNFMSVNEHYNAETDKFFSGINDRPLVFLCREDLNKIRSLTIPIAGFGGVGAIVAELLARWGIEKFRLLDNDRYDITNIQRQVFATASTLGCYKAEVAAKRIMEIDPYSGIEMVICEKLSRETCERFIAGQILY